MNAFVEHHQQYQVLWNGENGRTYFYQSEIPYDPPNQPSYTSAKGVNGWASYKVADHVKHHEAWGLGIYSVFLKPNVTLTRAIEAPHAPDVRFHHMITSAPDAPIDEDELGKLMVFSGVREFPIRIKCATLAWHALAAALENKHDGVSTES